MRVAASTSNLGERLALGFRFRLAKRGCKEIDDRLNQRRHAEERPKSLPQA
jgi:hypothetical protein